MASDKMLGSFDQKTTPEDNDLLVEYDATASKVKNVKFGGVWNWIVKKLTSAVISELQTSNQSVVGAINELNSKKAQFISIAPNKKATLTYSAYTTSSIIITQSGLYTYINGYLVTIKADSSIKITLSTSYLIMTIENQVSTYNKVGVFFSTIIPQITTNS